MLCNGVVTGKKLFWPTLIHFYYSSDLMSSPEAQWKQWHQPRMCVTVHRHSSTQMVWHVWSDDMLHIVVISSCTMENYLLTVRLLNVFKHQWADVMTGCYTSSTFYCLDVCSYFKITYDFTKCSKYPKPTFYMLAGVNNINESFHISSIEFNLKWMTQVLCPCLLCLYF